MGLKTFKFKIEIKEEQEDYADGLIKFIEEFYNKGYYECMDVDMEADYYRDNMLTISYEGASYENTEFIDNLIEITLEEMDRLIECANEISFYYLNEDFNQLIILKDKSLRILNSNRPEAITYRIKHTICRYEEVENVKIIMPTENKNEIMIDLKNEVEKKDKIIRLEAEQAESEREMERSFWDQMESVGVTPEDVFD